MKRAFIVAVLIIVNSSIVFCQSGDQMRKMAFNGKSIDFTQTPPFVTSINSPLIGANGAYASYYNENDELVVRVVDNLIYDKDNNVVDTLFDNSSNEYYLLPDIIIAPKDKDKTCELYIFYQLVHIDINSYSSICENIGIYNTGKKNWLII